MQARVQAPTSAAFNVPADTDIRKRLEEVAADHPGCEFEMSIMQGGARSAWSLRGHGTIVGAPANLIIRANCFVKPFTVAALVLACEQRGISLDAPIGELIGDPDASRQWEGITLRHLLMHTHGLHDAAYRSFPLRPDGRIDIDALRRRMSGIRRLNAPGAMFSGTDIGPLLAAAVVECVVGVPFDKILSEQLQSTHDIERMRARNSDIGGAAASLRICPTNGGALTLSTNELLDLAQRFCDDAGVAASMLRSEIEFPSWSTMGVAGCLGWHCFPEGWYGYNAGTDDDGFHLLRFHPASGNAIAVVTRGIPAYRVYAAVFEHIVPEIAFVRRPMDPPTQRPFDLRCAVGSFEVGPLIATFAFDDKMTLGVTITNRSEQFRVVSAPISRVIRRAGGNGFYTMPLETKILPYGRFLDQVDESGRFEYLWNGRYLWRRMPESSAH